MQKDTTDITRGVTRISKNIKRERLPMLEVGKTMFDGNMKPRAVERIIMDGPLAAKAGISSAAVDPSADVPEEAEQPVVGGAYEEPASPGITPEQLAEATAILRKAGLLKD
jgi:hypothetical protein